MRKTESYNYFAEDRIFYLAIVLSLVAHILTIFYLSLTKINLFKKSFKQIEVTYQNIKPKEVKTSQTRFKDFKITPQELDELKNVKIVAHKASDDSALNSPIKDISKIPDPLKLENKIISKIGTFDINQKVTIPVFKSEKITNPKYLGYQDSLRHKIHFIVSKYVKNQDIKASKVYLTFSLLSDGQLKQVQVIDSRSNAADNLKDICSRSIQEAAPFPPFPDGLNYPELTYNVEIEFRSGE